MFPFIEVQPGGALGGLAQTPDPFTFFGRMAAMETSLASIAANTTPPTRLGRFQDEFVAAAGQTQFTLTYTPLSLSDVQLTLNQFPQSRTNLLSINGNTLTITAAAAGDSVWINYERAN